MLFRGGEFEMAAVCVRGSISYKFRDKSPDLTGEERTGVRDQGLVRGEKSEAARTSGDSDGRSQKQKETDLELRRSRSHSEKTGAGAKKIFSMANAVRETRGRRGPGMLDSEGFRRLLSTQAQWSGRGRNLVGVAFRSMSTDSLTLKTTG